MSLNSAAVVLKDAKSESVSSFLKDPSLTLRFDHALIDPSTVCSLCIRFLNSSGHPFTSSTKGPGVFWGTGDRLYKVTSLLQGNVCGRV